MNPSSRRVRPIQRGLAMLAAATVLTVLVLLLTHLAGSRRQAHADEPASPASPPQAAAPQAAAGAARDGTSPPPAPATRPAGRLDRWPTAAGRETAEAQAQRSRPAAASQPTTAPTMDLAKLDCGTCHSCEAPTRESPCLRTCPRSIAEMIAAAAHEILPQQVLLLDAFDWQERRFMPVPFNHRLHSDMAGMAGGCDTCHHHTTPGKLHPPCRDCHKAELGPRGAEDELRMPGLKGAYHRQCMGCHRDWSHTTKCGICHLPKGDSPHPVKPEEVLPRGDMAGLHPPIENPEKILVKTEYQDGPNVMFRHREHVEVYGYECERCHRGQACSRCHEQAAKPRETADAVKRATHDACFNCHENDACERCHTHEQEPSHKPFDHSLTGLPLEKYHGKLTCRACHKRLLFLRQLESECSTCHQGWGPDTFDHKVTGQTLDESHAAADCAECHPDGRFVHPPRCGECHEEDVTFPAKRPGPVVTPQTQPGP